MKRTDTLLTPEPHTAAGIRDVKKKINTAGSRGEAGHFKSWAGGIKGEQQGGGTLSRVFHIKSADVISLTTCSMGEAE